MASVTERDPLVAGLIRAAKDPQSAHWVGPMARAMVRESAAHLRVDLIPTTFRWILSPPIHRPHWRRRGFDPALELAQTIATLSGIAMAPARLEFLHDRGGQRTRSARERWTGYRSRVSAKALKGVAEGSRVLLIDDLITTSATIQACAHALKKHAKVSEVIAYSFAKTPKTK